MKDSVPANTSSRGRHSGTGMRDRAKDALRTEGLRRKSDRNGKRPGCSPLALERTVTPNPCGAPSDRPAQAAGGPANPRGPGVAELRSRGPGTLRVTRCAPRVTLPTPGTKLTILQLNTGTRRWHRDGRGDEPGHPSASLPVTTRKGWGCPTGRLLGQQVRTWRGGVRAGVQASARGPSTGWGWGSCQP